MEPRDTIAGLMGFGVWARRRSGVLLTDDAGQ